MRPFFSYYGAKYTVAKYAGAPRRDLVIEPFAGSAAYSTRYAPRHVALYDISPDVCAIWDWLIHCSEADVRAVPDTFDAFDEIGSLSRAAALLMRFWVSKGRAEPSAVLSPWYRKYRDSHDCKVWGPAVSQTGKFLSPVVCKRGATVTKSQILAALQKTNKLLDEHHRGEMYASDDCPVCI